MLALGGTALPNFRFDLALVGLTLAQSPVFVPPFAGVELRLTPVGQVLPFVGCIVASVRCPLALVGGELPLLGCPTSLVVPTLAHLCVDLSLVGAFFATVGLDTSLRHVSTLDAADRWTRGADVTHACLSSLIRIGRAGASLSTWIRTPASARQREPEQLSHGQRSSERVANVWSAAIL